MSTPHRTDDSPDTRPIPIQQLKQAWAGRSGILKRLFSEHSARVWQVVGGVFAVIAVLFTAWQLWFSTEEPELRLERVGVTDATAVSARSTDVSSPNAGGTSSATSTSAIDIRVKNAGTVSAYVSQADATVLFAQPLEDCREAGGEVRASANYSIRVPSRPIDQPLRLPSQEIDYQVEAGKVDRLTFSVGPDQESLSTTEVWVYVTNVDLLFDGPDSPLATGPVASVSRSGGGHTQLDAAVASGRFDCAEKNLKLLERARDLSTTRSPELEQLIAESEKALHSNDAPAAARCVDDQQAGPGMSRACFTFSKRSLTARLTLDREPTPNTTQVMLKISQTGSPTPYRWAAFYYDVGWRAGFIEQDDPATLEYAGNGCGPCEIFGGGTQIELSSPPGELASARELAISVELQDASDRSRPRTIDAMPERVVVQRGS